MSIEIEKQGGAIGCLSQNILEKTARICLDDRDLRVDRQFLLGLEELPGNDLAGEDRPLEMFGHEFSRRGAIGSRLDDRLRVGPLDQIQEQRTTLLLTIERTAPTLLKLAVAEVDLRGGTVGDTGGLPIAKLLQGGADRGDLVSRLANRHPRRGAPILNVIQNRLPKPSSCGIAVHRSAISTRPNLAL